MLFYPVYSKSDHRLVFSLHHGRLLVTSSPFSIFTFLFSVLSQVFQNQHLQKSIKTNSFNGDYAFDTEGCSGMEIAPDPPTLLSCA